MTTIEAGVGHRADAVARNDFDVALIPGARAALREAYCELRQAEEEYYAGTRERTQADPAGHLMARDCPLCGCRACAPFIDARGLRIVTCSGCGHVYSREVFTTEFEAQRYAAADAGVWPAYLRLKEQAFLTQIERLRNRYYLDACERQVPIGRLLDVGSGNGSLLREAAERGWQAQGVDPNPVWQNIRGELGIRPRPGRFPDVLAPHETFDVITLLDVLEHMADPATFLLSVKRHLSPDGAAFIQVPNLNSLLIRLEGAANNNFCPGHWSYFDAASLARLGRDCGLLAVWTETVISELDRIEPFGAARIASVAGTLTPNPPDDPARPTPEWLHANLLGYKLVCIMKKEASA